MSEHNPIAPVALDSVDVVASESEVLPDVPADLSLGLSIDLDSAGLSLRHDDEREAYEMDVPLTVECRLADTDDSSSVVARFKATVVASVSVLEAFFDGVSEGDREGMVFDYLRMNGVSMAYGHARSFILMVSALSPTGRVTLPPVLPRELIEATGGEGAEL